MSLTKEAHAVNPVKEKPDIAKNTIKLSDDEKGDGSTIYADDVDDINLEVPDPKPSNNVDDDNSDDFVGFFDIDEENNTNNAEGPETTKESPHKSIVDAVDTFDAEDNVTHNILFSDNHKTGNIKTEDNVNGVSYDGKPSIELKQRPFFSIIIPCYNSGDTLGLLLESIHQQNMDDYIEVICADDHSTRSYQDVINQYSKMLCIRQVQTAYNFAPGNTRERGASVATGEWICFADHDDEFVPNTLGQVREVIQQTEEKYYVICNFAERNPQTGQISREMKQTRNWNHAKFYNLDNLWKPYNIHFKKDLLTHEDIYVSSCVNCAMKQINDDHPLYVDLCIYLWNARPTTISREKYGNHSFLEVFYNDYIVSTGWVYLNKYIDTDLDTQYCADSVLEVLLYAYFYYESFLFEHPKDYKPENTDYARKYLIAIKKAFGFTNKFIWEYIANKDDMFRQVELGADIATGPYMATHTFWQWLNMLHEDIDRVTMRDAISKENKPY